ncbi:MAG: LptA, protein essential for transport across the periplasm [Pseudomonadota bacterium]|jgi:lipopolysaccharide export system protein LptA
MSAIDHSARCIIRRVLTLAVSLTLTSLAVALEADKDQNVIYSSSGNSTSRVENNTRIITIEGDVRVTQGTLQITGDRAVFERVLDSDSITRITISGSPATYQQQLETDGAVVMGDSSTILYYSEGEPVIELVGSANLKQGNDILSCVSIKYFTDSGITHYTGPCSGVLTRQTD